MDEWRIERLDKEHMRQGFDCGKPPLNDFVHSLVSQYEKRNLGRTYVAFQGGDPRVLGYTPWRAVRSTWGAYRRNWPRNLPGIPCLSSCSHVWPLIEAFTEEG